MRLTGAGVLDDVEEGTALRWRREGEGAGEEEEEEDSDSEAADHLQQGPDVGPVISCSPSHRVPLHSINEGSKRVSMTWRALSGRPYPWGDIYLAEPVPDADGNLSMQAILDAQADADNRNRRAGVPTLEEAETEALAALPMDQQQRLATAFVGFKVGARAFLILSLTFIDPQGAHQVSINRPHPPL